jgi:hypothetical protein
MSIFVLEREHNLPSFQCVQSFRASFAELRLFNDAAEMGVVVLLLSSTDEYVLLSERYKKILLTFI